MKARHGSRLGAALHRRLDSSPVPPWLLDYSRFHVFELPQVEVEPAEEAALTFAPLGADGLAQIAACREMADPDEGVRQLIPRLEQGCICTGMWQEGRLIGYAWANQGANVLEDRDLYRMRTGQSGAYIFDTFIHPEFRGRGLYPVLLRALQERMRALGVQRFYLTVDVYNARSIKEHTRVGARLLETITYACVLGFRFHGAVQTSIRTHR